MSAVILAVADNQPKVLTVGEAALPTGPLLAAQDRTLDKALRRLVSQQLGREMGYVEQLYTFGDLSRDPDVQARLLSIAYLALAREEDHPGSRTVYQFFPWEDWRRGTPSCLPALTEALRDWAADHPERQTRIRICFGLDGAPYNGERVLERFELLYEVGLVEESSGTTGLGEPMALDHRRILATALTRLRGKIRYRPVVFELLPQQFTLLRLQRTVEALAGVTLHKQNFRRLVEHQGLVEGTGRVAQQQRGRPAELFCFRSDVLTERPAPGVGLPTRG